jgi:hypothetical protein
MRIARGLLVILALGLCGLLLPCGCSQDSSLRSVVRIVSVNANNPLQSDVVKVNSDGTSTVYEDAVEVQVSNTPHDATLNLTPNGPFSSVTLDRYVVRFEGSESVAQVSGALGWSVPSGQTVSGQLIIVPAQWKQELPLCALAQGGEILTTAHITIFGREATSNMAFQTEATLPVNFANWADSAQP